MSTDAAIAGGVPPAFVRTAGLRDVPAIRQLLVETWHATYDPIYGPERVREITDSWHSHEALQSRLSIPESEFVLADNGERLLGMAYALLHGDHVDLKQLYITPDAQGLGIGTLLLAEIENCFDEAHAIFCEVEAANRRAAEFYAARGFQIVDRRDHCNGEQGFETLLLRKTMPDAG